LREKGRKRLVQHRHHPIRGRGDDQELGSEAWHSPADGASGDCERDAARAENDESGAAAAGTGQAIYRADAGGMRCFLILATASIPMRFITTLFTTP
jgi:hypothetical protein